MAQTVDVAFVHAFSDLLIGLYQTAPENIRSTVRNRTVTGKTDSWERLGGVELVPVTSRHQETPHTPMTHTRRRVNLSDFAGSEMLDKLDEVKMLIDPRSEYTQNLVKAWQRRVTRAIVACLNASAIVVANDDSLSTQALQASQSIANGGTGFTMAKWRQANRILDNAGVPRDGRTVIFSAFAVEDLLADTQVTSKDYNDLAALQRGTIDGAMFMGAKAIVIADAVPDDSAVLTGGTANPILPKSGNIRSCFLYHRDAVGLSIGKELETNIDRLPTRLNSWQVMVLGSLGAVRILDAGVVQIDIDETA